MFGVYFVVSLFYSLSPSVIRPELLKPAMAEVDSSSVLSPALFTALAEQSAAFGLLSPPKEVTLGVQFDSVDELSVGAPVVLNGVKVGSVKKISELDKPSSDGSYLVELKLSGQLDFSLSSKTVALQTYPLTVNTPGRSETIIELIEPEHKGAQLAPGQKIEGYTSIEDYWAKS